MHGQAAMEEEKIHLQAAAEEKRKRGCWPMKAHTAWGRLFRRILLFCTVSFLAWGSMAAAAETAGLERAAWAERSGPHSAMMAAAGGSQAHSGISENEPSIWTDRASYDPHEPITVYVDGLPGNEQDWLTVVPAADAGDTFGSWWHYTQGVVQGTFLISGGLGAGHYEARLYLDWPAGGYEVAARHPFVVGDPVAEEMEASGWRIYPESQGQLFSDISRAEVYDSQGSLLSTVRRADADGSFFGEAAPGTYDIRIIPQTPGMEDVWLRGMVVEPNSVSQGTAEFPGVGAWQMTIAAEWEPTPTETARRVDVFRAGERRPRLLRQGVRSDGTVFGQLAAGRYDFLLHVDGGRERIWLEDVVVAPDEPVDLHVQLLTKEMIRTGLTASDWQQRRDALSAAGPALGQEGLDRLMAMLSDPKPQVRADALYGLSFMAGELTEAILLEDVVPAFADPYWRVRANAAVTFLRYGEAAKGTFAMDRLPVHPLLKPLQDPVAEVRSAAAAAFINAAVEPLHADGDLVREVEAAFARILEDDPCYEARWAAVTAARHLHLYGDAVSQGILAALHDPVDMVKKSAEETFDSMVWSLARQLPYMSQPTRPAQRLIYLEALDHPGVRFIAAGWWAEEAAPLWAEYQETGEHAVDLEQLVSALLRAVGEDDDPQTRQAAASALQAMDYGGQVLADLAGKQRLTVPFLVRLLADDQWSLRQAAAEMAVAAHLPGMPVSKSLQGALEHALQDDHWLVRRAAEEALEQLQAADELRRW